MDFLICQTFAASPAEPGELPFWFSWDSVSLSSAGSPASTNAASGRSATRGRLDAQAATSSMS
jgi:hypothetical protein